MDASVRPPTTAHARLGDLSSTDASPGGRRREVLDGETAASEAAVGNRPYQGAIDLWCREVRNHNISPYFPETWWRQRFSNSISVGDLRNAIK
jgi:hypothetical protein